MALRVLLADESSTIKRVMQLALQDFGVEVKAVPIGLDVLDVCKSFQPDIVFADVLLSKRSGYDVAADIKSDKNISQTPVVLMWSGFMEIDEEKARLSKADRRLEKPFDADQLRGIIKDLVPKLSDNLISDYLTFPDLPPIIEDKKSVQTQELPPAPPREPQIITPKHAPPPPPPMQNFSVKPEKTPAPKVSGDLTQFQVIDDLHDLDDPDEFQQVPLPGRGNKEILSNKSALIHEDNEDWRQGGLENFRVGPELSDQALLKGHVQFSNSEENFEIEQIDELNLNSKPLSSYQEDTSLKKSMTTSPSGLDPQRAEEILREQAREVLESIAWKIIPDITERIVREEIQRLLKESERF